ncbi:MAG: phosphoglycerate kinase, partial [Candidatus Cloacimonetes bacterium]|nr:phosphoglycerate kinase [Candidatus Cloacimonadota bacterium]
MREYELLPKIQDADLKDKVVLVRMDHNVVKKGKIKDAFRIDATFATLFYILAKGGKPVLMTHIGRPKDKKTGKINISYEEDVKPVVEYLKQKLGLQIAIPQFKRIDEDGYYGIDSSINFMLRDLRQDKIDLIYLPNTRFFMGEEAKGEMRDAFGKQLAGLADIFVNDAFGSWQPHASTVKPAEYLPAYAGLLMQKEISNLQKIFEPDKPFLAVVAGSKFDTKIGPLRSILKKVDHLLLGGVIYNAYLSVKYGIEIKGIDPADLDIAKEFVALAKENPGK